MGEVFERLAAYWHSLRYLQSRQLVGRLRYRLGWELYPRFPAAVRAWCEPSRRSCRPRPDFVLPASLQAGRRPPCHLGGNHFCFLNQSVDFGDRIDWNPVDRSLLWRFHLHYFDWAPGCVPELLARHMESWIESNPAGSWPGWHPYPTSLRIVNWIRASAAGVAPPLADSLATQASFLERNLEFHLGGNHLLENAWALLAAGLYFEGPSAGRWLARGLELLRREIDEQVLPDGGHFERSPFYHLRMTRLVSDAIELLAAQGLDAPPELARAARKMTAFHLALRHQDGGLPLFHDSLDSPLDPRPVVPGSCSFPSSGYYVLESRAGRLIADYGAPGACYNPAHQHAGIFSFEISSGAKRAVVDSGTETYDPGPRRRRLRSTAAHNTVRVDGRDQFQVWDTFRVGRRAWVSVVEQTSGPHFQAISAVHDGYARLGVEHRRSIVSLAGAGWLIVDELSGRGVHCVESFVHLAPGVTPLMDEAGRVCLSPLDWTLLAFGLAGIPEIISDTYSPAIGVTEPAQTLLIRSNVDLPCRFGYYLGPLAVSRLVWDGRCNLRIETPADAITVRLDTKRATVAEVSYNTFFR